MGYQFYSNSGAVRDPHTNRQYPISECFKMSRVRWGQVKR